jgi:hypothetical protein
MLGNLQVQFGEGSTEKARINETSPAAYSTLRGAGRSDVVRLPDSVKLWVALVCGFELHWFTHEPIRTYGLLLRF